MSIKAVLIGDSSVGKSSIFRRIECDEFDGEFISTINGSYARIEVVARSERRYSIGLWDTAGQERYRSLIPMYFQLVGFIIIVFDVTSRDSFNSLREWFDMSKQHAPPSATIIIVGNKIDLKDEKKIYIEEATEVAKSLGAAYFESSAKTGEGINALLAEIANYIDDSMNISKIDDDFVVVDSNAVDRAIKLSLDNVSYYQIPTKEKCKC